MKFTYTYINGNIINKTIYKINQKNKLITNKIQINLDNNNIKNK